jgi:hypothetical protein
VVIDGNAANYHDLGQPERGAFHQDVELVKSPIAVSASIPSASKAFDMEAGTVASLWTRLLDGVPVRIDDDFFFDLGGHSLLAAAIVSELAASTGLPVELRDLYLAPTPRELACYLGHLNRRLDEYRSKTACTVDLDVIADALSELGASAADSLLPPDVTVDYGKAEGTRVGLLRQIRGNGVCEHMNGDMVLVRRGEAVLRLDLESGPDGGGRIRVTDVSAEVSCAVADR